jgi:collagenase-like PrtC family protease
LETSHQSVVTQVRHPGATIESFRRGGHSRGEVATKGLSRDRLAAALAELRAMGVSRFRLSPHACDMARVASIFRAVLDQRLAASEGTARLDAMKLPAPFSNGFYHGKQGHSWTGITARP